MAEPLVVKVGGSLLAWPELRPRLLAWYTTLPTAEVVLIPGGGSAADVIRQFDRDHRLGPEAAHWLAIRAMGLNAHCLAALLPRARVVDRLAELPWAWSANEVPILDCLPVLVEDEGQSGRLPHSWAVTSDSIAARIAELLGGRFVLLKSAPLLEGQGWREAAQDGLVDAAFAEIVARGKLEVRVVNLRE